MALKPHMRADSWDENNCRNTGERTRSHWSTPILKGSPATSSGTRVATSWSGALSGMAKPIRKTLHPVENLSDRSGATTGVTPTSLPSAVRSARSWFPKRSTISGVFGWCCPCWRECEGRKYGGLSNRITVFSCRALLVIVYYICRIS